VPVHVSLHDVSPATAGETEEALSLCRARGLVPALLVVPDHHGRAPLGASPEFCSRLRQLQRAGHEVFLHGHLHRSRPEHAGREDGRPGRLGWLFAQAVVSGGEAEFSDLTRAEAAARLDAGEAALVAAGLRIEGFVPPAWSMPGWLLPELARRGYRYCEDHLRIFDPASGRARPSVVLNFASRTPARRRASIAWCRVARAARALLPTRVAIHPGDLRSQALRRELASLLDWAQGDAVRSGAELLSWRA
jgi:hypothetical protein